MWQELLPLDHSARGENASDASAAVAAATCVTAAMDPVTASAALGDSGGDGSRIFAESLLVAGRVDNGVLGDEERRFDPCCRRNL